eukprot:3731037-Rhodomonas_salina.1
MASEGNAAVLQHEGSHSSTVQGCTEGLLSGGPQHPQDGCQLRSCCRIQALGASQQLLQEKKQRLDNEIAKAVVSMPPASHNAFQLCTSLKPLLAAALFLADSVVKEQELCVQVEAAYLHKFTVNLENLNLALQAVKEHLQELHVRHILFPKCRKVVIN